MSVAQTVYVDDLIDRQQLNSRSYVLLGLRADCPDIFRDMAWSTAAVAAETRRRLAARGMRVWLGPTLHDIDEPADRVQLPSEWKF